ncbi:MAG: ion transporter [Thermoanaerobaculia bacterium]|nr:ion transporter [Thermoanaerobaculia bacterium]
MTSIRRIVEESDTPAGRAFDLAVQTAILVSVISFSLETLPDLSPETREVLRWVDWVTILLFSAEYVLRVVVAESRARYVFSFYGLVDLAAIVPFFLSTRLDLRCLRALRFLRLFRVLKMARYSHAVRRFEVAFRRVREELVLFFFATCLLLYISAVGIHYFEHEAQPESFQSVPHSLWWAVATLTTVGYGDIYPITPGGRFFTFVVLMIGLGIVAVPSGLLATALTEARVEDAGSTEVRVPPESSS